MDDSSKQSDEAYMLYDEYGFFRFTVRELLWLISLIAVGLGTFGTLYGTFVIVATLIAIRILRRWISSRDPIAFAIDLATITLCVFITLMAIFGSNHSIRDARTLNYRSQIQNSMKHIMLSALNYESTHQHWSEPYTVDDNGNRLHSWRTLLLPFAEEPDLFASIDLKSSWKEIEINKLLQNSSVQVFKSPASQTRGQKNQFTNYFAIVDSETVWNPNASVRTSDITDGTSKTIALMEVFNRKVAWYEPKDLTLDEAVNILTGKDDFERVRTGFFYSERVRGSYLNQRVICFADGHIQTIGTIKDSKVARALLTRAGGEEIPEDWWKSENKSEVIIGIIIHWGNCFSTLLYTHLALFPIIEAFRKRRSNLVVVT